MMDNYTLISDFYELTMANGYLESGMGGIMSYFDVFFREVPDGGGFVIAAGLEQIVRYINDLHFSWEDIEYLRAKGIFSEAFLDYLKDFKFTGDLWAAPEGTPVFPHEPVMIVRATALEAQFIETFILNCFNHQSLIATKANRIVRAAAGRPVMEFGARRAHGAEAALMGARAAYIGGCCGSSCTKADTDFGVPAMGTMAHSWVQMFPDELSSFKAYCNLYPDNACLLVDTFNVLKSGIPNAMRAFAECLPPKGERRCSIRLDSGDITYLTKKARAMLDRNGFEDCKIVISNSLDEEIIRDLILQGAYIDSFGVGERLITCKSDPVLGGVYKLAAVEGPDGGVIPKIKISENASKITTPHFKNVYRLFIDGKATADLVTLRDERPDPSKPLELFDPDFIWKRSTITGFTPRELLVHVFEGGKQIYELPGIEEIREYCRREVGSLWEEVKRFENPHNYYVDLSQRLWELKNNMISGKR